MHVTILSRGESVHSTRRLVEAAKALGHRSRVLDPVALQLNLGDGTPGLFVGDRKLGRTDVVIPRIAQSINTYGVAVVNHFELQGTAVLNDSQSISRARNKLGLMQLLSGHGLPVPPTVIGRGADALKRMVALVGGFPVAVKLVEGTDRSGVIVAESAQSMEAALEAVLSMGHDIVVQRFLDGKQGRDLRALVVGGEVIASVRRLKVGKKLRHSLGAGREAVAFRLTKEQKQMASAAARIVGLEVAAVDLLETKKGGTRVFDVHSSPGLRDLEEATGEDLAKPIVARAIELARHHRTLVAMDARTSRRQRSGSRG